MKNLGLKKLNKWSKLNLFSEPTALRWNEPKHLSKLCRHALIRLMSLWILLKIPLNMLPWALQIQFASSSYVPDDLNVMPAWIESEFCWYWVVDLLGPCSYYIFLTSFEFLMTWVSLLHIDVYQATPTEITSAPFQCSLFVYKCNVKLFTGSFCM